jgi:hypothetical protein
MLLLGAILVCHVAALWAGTLVFAFAASRWRLRRSAPSDTVPLLALWIGPAAALAALSVRGEWALPPLALVLSVGACAVAALFAPRLVVWYRHTTVAARILALFLAFLAPALLLYPAMDFFAERATRRLITTQYAVQAASYPQMLQERLTEARHEIDAISSLPTVVSDASSLEFVAPRTDEGRAAFLIWRQTVLARERLTSAIELYGINGALVSRFALNFPEYTGTAQIPQAARACDWDVFGEAAPFGSEERRMLRAELWRGDSMFGQYDALNDVVIGRGTVARVVRLRVVIDNTQPIHHVADGIIVATPTGSTAYTVSAGGPIADPRVRAMIVTPIAPHLSLLGSIIVPDSAVIDIIVESDYPALISMDGQVELTIESGDRVRVCTTDRVSRFVRTHPTGYFYASLSQRLKL